MTEPRITKPRKVLCIELLKTFSEKEFSDFTNFISCPYFNTDKYIIELLKVLKTHALDEKVEVFKHELQVIVYQKVFGDTPMSEWNLNESERVKLNKRLRRMTELAEQFLFIENTKKTDIYNKSFYDELLRRDQFMVLDKRLQKDKKNIHKKQSICYRQRYEIEHGRFYYLYKSGKLTKENNIPSALSSSLDLDYLLSKLSFLVTRLSLRYEFDEGYQGIDEELNTIRPLLELPPYADHPLIILYLANIELLKTKSETSYIRLLTLLEEHTIFTPTDLLIAFYATATMYCVTKINQGHFEYNQAMHDLYKIMHEKNLLIEDNFIQIGKLKNMITMACRAEEFDWAGQVLTYYKKFIPKLVRNSVCNYNLGIIAFYQKDYEKADTIFSKVGNIDAIHDINTRILRIKCIYEKEKHYSNYDMQTFRSALKYFKENKSLASKIKKRYINFIKTFIHVYKFRHHETKMSLESIETKVNQQDTNADKRWLLEKIEELK